MRKAWEDLKTPRICTSQERLHPTNTMETNTSTARMTHTNLIRPGQTWFFLSMRLLARIGDVSRFSHQARIQTSTTLIEACQSWFDWETWAQEPHNRGEVIKWCTYSVRAECHRQYYLIMILWKYQMCHGQNMVHELPSSISYWESLLLDWWPNPCLEPMFWLFVHGRNDVKRAGGQQCWNLCVSPKPAGKTW